MLTILPIGGRIKSASIGLDRLFAVRGVELDKAIAQMRREPCHDTTMAFFPRVGNELRHMTSGIGLYRPILKTDQGMPGNFLPFTVDLTLDQTDCNVRMITTEEGVVIPEAWHIESNGLSQELQAAFLDFDLKTVYHLLQKLEGRRAEKGRWPFMFIRPAQTDRPIVFGRDVVRRVEQEVQNVLGRCVALARRIEEERTGSSRPANLLYAQPDVFVLTDGTIAVERINCPDVGFFLTGIEATGSHVFPHVRGIVAAMLDHVANRIIERIGTRITIVTRDAVLSQQEDVLEIREIEILKEALSARGARVHVISASDVNSAETGARLLLLNLDYRCEEATDLLRRHAAGEVECFPNPYVQMACSQVSGLPESVLPVCHKHRKRFMDLTRSETSSGSGTLDVLRHIDKALASAGINDDIIHASLATETVPILRGAMHAWRQFAARADRLENRDKPIVFRGIPARPENLLMTSSTGPRLHAFRFMCVA